MPVKPYIPRTYDQTDQLLPVSTMEDDLERACARGFPVDERARQLRKDPILTGRTSMSLHGLKMPGRPKRRKRYGRWRMSLGGGLTPIDGAARRCLKEMQALEKSHA